MRAALASFPVVRTLLPAFAAALWLGAAGCMSHPIDSDPTFNSTQEWDIPAPQDFEFDKDGSNSYILYRDPRLVGSFRSGWVYYYGDQQVTNLVPWYLEQMKVDGWTHKDTSSEADRRRLVFTKGDETATIWLYRDFRFDRYKTVIKAEIRPTRVEEMAAEEILHPAEAAWPSDEDDAALKSGNEPESIQPSGSSIDSSTTGRQPGIIRIPARAGKETVRAGDPEAGTDDRNKQVVNEETGVENNEEPLGGELTPEDAEK